MTDDEINDLLKKLDFFKDNKDLDYSTMPYDSKEDCCPKCGTKGIFVKMALMCIRCQIVIGGI